MSELSCLPPSQVCEKPLMYLVDTPGVLPPKLGDVETGMKLALCGEVEAVAGGLPKCGFKPWLGREPAAHGPPQAGVHCPGAHGWHVDSRRGGWGPEQGWGGARA